MVTSICIYLCFSLFSLAFPLQEFPFYRWLIYPFRCSFVTFLTCSVYSIKKTFDLLYAIQPYLPSPRVSVLPLAHLPFQVLLCYIFDLFSKFYFKKSFDLLYAVFFFTHGSQIILFYIGTTFIKMNPNLLTISKIVSLENRSFWTYLVL